MIGHDVEFFLIGDSGLIPAERVLAGTKGRGTAIAKGVLAHPDNVMAEISSAAPFAARNLKQRMMHDLNALRHHVDPVRVSIASSMNITRDTLDNCESAKEIGCSLDYQNGMPRDKLNADDLGDTRHAGGHLHFDVSPSIAPDWAARVCDIMLGCHVIAAGEKQGARRGFYGLPGLYRPKSYGMEYRTLSNYWVRMIVDGRADEFLRRVTLCSAAFEKIVPEILELPTMFGDMAVDVISSENVGEAANLDMLVSQHIDTIAKELLNE